MLDTIRYTLIILLLLMANGLGEDYIPKDGNREQTEISKLAPLNITKIDNFIGFSTKYRSSKIYVSNNIVEGDLSQMASYNNIGIDDSISSKLHQQGNSDLFDEDEKNRNTMVRVFFDNDIFSNTDYYYTNGVRLEVVAKFIENTPTAFILPRFTNSTFDYQGFSVVQNIYTPIDPESETISLNDRPFSSYLTIGHFRESYDVDKGLRLRSEISLGVLGPASLGGRVQSSLHELDPLGWVNQIKNDIVLDYSVTFEKSIVEKKIFELYAKADGRIGSLYDNVGAGVSMRFGKFLPILENQLPGLKRYGSSRFKFWVFSKAKLKFVAYDATLQGGMFNSSSVYTIQPDQLNRFVIDASLGFAVYHKNFGFEYEHFYLSPEFQGAKDFKYGRIIVVIGL